jgi:hypothetical protein
VAFNSVDNQYKLQFTAPVGTSTLPDPSFSAGVGLYEVLDSTVEWTAGTRNTATAAGTITFDGTHGTVDVDMLPDTSTPNPALGPIHVTGTFDCPSP